MLQSRERPGSDNQHIASIALSVEGSIATLRRRSSAIFGLRALTALRLGDQRIPTHYLSTFQGPAHGIVMEREYLKKYVRPSLGATVEPKLGLSLRNHDRVVCEALKGGLNLTV